jgi:predicted transcriptional regulator
MTKNVGTRNFKSKLTEDDVRDIRANNLTQKQNAEKYRVSQSLVSRIRRGRLWRHLAEGIAH